MNAAERWQLPEIDGEPVAPFGREASSDLPTAKRLEALQKQAYEEGFEFGRREGRAQGLAQGEAHARAEAERVLGEHSHRLSAIFARLAFPLSDLDEAVERGVADLAILIARHLVRRELRVDPGEVIRVVREAIGCLPVASRHPRIHLNPDDVELVREVLSVDEDASGWRLQADPLITRGGCLVETATSFIDATVEARLNAIIARALGGERSTDRG
ncbi:MAG: flagellar assembly protein FliH [Gammaproteobacteria bacterium]